MTSYTRGGVQMAGFRAPPANYTATPTPQPVAQLSVPTRPQTHIADDYERAYNPYMLCRALLIS